MALSREFHSKEIRSKNISVYENAVIGMLWSCMQLLISSLKNIASDFHLLPPQLSHNANPPYFPYSTCDDFPGFTLIRFKEFAFPIRTAVPSAHSTTGLGPENIKLTSLFPSLKLLFYNHTDFVGAEFVQIDQPLRKRPSLHINCTSRGLEGRSGPSCSKHG